MEIIKLPSVLPGELDLLNINKQLREHNIQLDWSAVVSAPESQLVVLLDGIDQVEDADWLINGDIAEKIATDIINFFNKQKPKVKKSRSKKKPLETKVTPQLWEQRKPLETQFIPSTNEGQLLEEKFILAIDPLIEEKLEVKADETNKILESQLPTPYKIRDELEKAVLADLLGPAGGEEEEVDEDSVSDRYLVGLLAPQQRRISAETVNKSVVADEVQDELFREVDYQQPELLDELAVVGKGTVEEGTTEVSVPPAETMFPSSFGMTFCVSGAAKVLQINAGWGQYKRTKSETITKKDDTLKMVWKRQQILGNSPPIPLIEGEIPKWTVHSEYPKVQVQGKIRQQSNGDWIVSLFLINGQKEPAKLRDEAWLFQPELSVQSADFQHLDIFLKRHKPRQAGKLGTLVGLYETAVDQLSSWEVDGKKVRPKVIASTATIRQAETQMHNLFLRKVQVFPPQGLDVEDNFFSRQRKPNETNPGRRYVGICATGRRLKAALIRVYVAILAASQDLYENKQYGNRADPWMTLVGYFNSMRELGGMRRLVDDDIRIRLAKMDSRGLAKRLRINLEELTSRKDSTDIPVVLDRLETSFDPVREAQIKAKRKAGQKVDQLEPLDVLLATNMISVGVDVKRLGVMAVTGQPKNTAEYIQATSRVGRTFPGIVFTVYNWARPRDLSHYERFEHYHATFYQHVEALSLTPFAPRAIDRGLAALFISLVRLAGREFNGNNQAGRIERNHPYIQSAINTICDRANLVAGTEAQKLVKQALEAKLDIWLSKAQNLIGGGTLKYQTDKRDGLTIELLESAGQGIWQEFTCLNSLPNVEPTVGLIFQDQVPDDDFSRLPQAMKE